MAHEIATINGHAAMAYAGETPWHGLGSQLTRDADLLTWQQEAGLDWRACEAPVMYDTVQVRAGDDGAMVHAVTPRTADGRKVLYRSDTGDALSVVSSRYNVVQPSDIIGFYRDLTERYGFTMETAGALRNGQKIWALARTPESMTIGGDDTVRGYLLLATSFDGSMATQARFTSVRVVCNNTLTVAAHGHGSGTTVVVPHSTTFDANSVKLDMKLGDAWAEFASRSHAMAERKVTRDETVRLMMAAYYNLTSTDAIREFQEDEKKRNSAEKLMLRLTNALFDSPGATLASARGTLWGAINAVTYDVDHATPSRSQSSRLDKAWFGEGESIKRRATEYAMTLI